MTIYTQTKTNIDCNKLFINSFLKQINHPFFHYTSVDNAKSIKSSQELWMTNYKQLIDKKEFFHGLDLIISYLNENCTRSANFRDYYERFLRLIKEERQNLQLEMYVMCFCRRKTNSYLAKNYSKGKSLYLVEFNFHPDDLGYLPVCLDVIYSQRQFLKNVEKLFIRYADYFYFHRNDIDFDGSSFLPSLVKDVFILAISFKHHKYAAEEEIRLVKFEDQILPYSIEKMPKTIIDLHPC